jgi:hypothetical protein
MGFMKDMRDLNKQARQIQSSMPPVGERMAQAQARMANAANVMAAQTAAASRQTAALAGLSDGSAERRSVTVNGIRQVGMMNFDLLVEFDLTVVPDGPMPPYPATVQQAVSQMQIGMIRPGTTMQAAVLRADPEAIWLDLNTIGQ